MKIIRLSDNIGRMTVLSISENIKSVLNNIEAVAKKAGRSSSDIKLIAVSKTKPYEMIEEAYECGLTEFGENRPQEIAEKYPLSEGKDISYHMIGHLQKNKVKMIIDKVCLIHSVDNIDLAKEINKRAKGIDKIQDILIQVNVTGEETKSGVSYDKAIDLCREISLFENIRIKGLMTISVNGYTFEENKEVFDKLNLLAREIESLNIKNVSMKELSMGMSHDYEAAIMAGATYIRVGSFIFGERDYSNL